MSGPEPTEPNGPNEPAPAPAREENLLEIWGDTVDSRDLIGALVLGAGVAAPAYLLASWGFAQVVENPDVGRTYALLVGLAGCMVGAVIAAVLFKPKRVVTESEGTAESRAAAMDTIEAEIGPLGDPGLLPEAVQSELRQLGLYEDLHERHLAKVAGTSAAAEPPDNPTAPTTRDTTPTTRDTTEGQR